MILFQGFTFFISLTKPDYVMKLVLSHDQLFAGQWWRLLTLLIVPPPMHPVFIIFYLFIYYFIGTALEARWGAFRYDLYLLIGYVATVLVVLIPGAIVTNFYLMESVFLAFAWLYPDFEFLLFLILPMKVKWLALIGWAFYVWVLSDGKLGDESRSGGRGDQFSAVFPFRLDRWDSLVQTQIQGRHGPRPGATPNRRCTSRRVRRDRSIRQKNGIPLLPPVYRHAGVLHQPH